MKKILIMLVTFSLKAQAETIDFVEMTNMLQNKILIYKESQKYHLWENIPKDTIFYIGIPNSYVNDLKNHLIISGEYKNYSDKGFIFTQDLSDSLNKYQENNNLTVTGNLNQETINKLNEPISTTIKTLSKNLERLKEYNYSGNYILINIPFYKLDIVYDNNSIYNMSVIVGKPKTPSCTLNSQITSIVFNPSWYVPNSIAKGEMIPKLTKNPSYFEKHNIKIMNQEGEEIDPYDYNDENLYNLKFIQSPGIKNALGKIKFIFKNDCGIYLHDTNQRDLFSKDKRGLSHGCIRLSDPELFAKYLMVYNYYNNEDILNYLSLTNTKIINLKNPLDIHIIYLDSYVNSNNEVLSRKDIYNKNK